MQVRHVHQDVGIYLTTTHAGHLPQGECSVQLNLHEREHSMTTTYTRDSDGHKATTVHDLQKQRELHITTYKSSNGPLVTSATVHQIEGDLKRHRFGCGGFGGDFSQRLVCTFPARVTAKTVKEQHEQCLQKLQEVLTAVDAHYAEQAKRQGLAHA